MSATGVTDLISSLIDRVARHVDGVDQRLEELRNLETSERTRMDAAIRAIAEDVASLKRDVADLNRVSRDLDSASRNEVLREEAKHRRHILWATLIASIISTLIGLGVAVLNRQAGVPQIPMPAPIQMPMQSPMPAILPPDPPAPVEGEQVP